VLLTIIAIEPATATSTGYEYINDTIHTWNNGSIASQWYYEKDCLNQISNLPNATWELQQKGIMIDHTGDEFDILLTDCEGTDYSDNLTIVENNRTKIIDLVGNKEIVVKINSKLGVNDDYIYQTHNYTPNFKVINDISYVMKFYNISIGESKQYDYLMIMNKSDNLTYYYNLSGVEYHNLTFWFNSSDYYANFIIDDVEIGQSIWHNWSIEYNWSLKLDGNVTLYYHFGEFERDETKTFRFQWVDAECACTCMLGQCNAIAEFTTYGVNNISVGDSFQMGCKPTLSGGICTTGCGLEFYTDQYGVPYYMMNTNYSTNVSDTFICDVAATQCVKKVLAYGAWHNATAWCEKNNTHLLFCKFEDVGGWQELSTGSQYTTCKNLEGVWEDEDDGLMLGMIIFVVVVMILCGGALYLVKDNNGEGD